MRTNEKKGKNLFLAQPIFSELWAVGNLVMAVVWMYLLPLIHCFSVTYF